MTGPRVAAAALFVSFAPFLHFVSAADINACKYVSVTELARDPWGIVEEVRKEAVERGFILVTKPDTVPPAETFKACVITADWLGTDVAGEVALQVMDAATGTPVAVARADGVNWFGMTNTLKGGLQRIFQEIGYTGFDEQVYRARMDRLYPPRPRIAITEADVARRASQGIEGIWTDADQQYRLGIIAMPESNEADYVAVVLQAAAPLWEPGEIKAEFTRTELPDRFTSTYYLLNKQPMTVTFTLSCSCGTLVPPQQADRLTATVSSAGATTEIALFRAPR